MMKKRLFVDFHVLQNVPPSCVNRDDTGSPKTAVYGGTTRARVSSQAWKRAIRRMFMEELADKEVGVRTKYVLDLLVQAIQKIAPDENAEKLAEDALAAVDVKVKASKTEPRKVTDALFFISPAQVDALAKLAVDGQKDKKEMKNALNSEPSLDVALFGRMVASNPELNMDASCQVAHCISTHTVHNEYDYFTAVDDCALADNAGAAHLDTVEYNSSTLYRYATICVNDLQKNMGGDVSQAVRSFGEAFICSMPTGKQNTFANRTNPDFVYVTIREDQPVNLVGAFEKPVPASAEGYMQRSADALLTYAGKVYTNFVDIPTVAYLVSNEDVAVDGIERLSRSAMLDKLAQEVSRRLADEVM